MEILAIDPGREKCGIAVLNDKKEILLRQVIATKDLAKAVQEISRNDSEYVLVMGNGTSSRSAGRLLQQVTGHKIVFVDEYRTTDAARVRYWQENPPRGWRKLLPVSLQVPPVPVDDYAALLLAERYYDALK